MSNEVSEYKPMTPHQLAAHVRTFIDDQRHNRDVDRRWLATSLVSVLERIYAVGNHNLTSEMQNRVNAFRADEIRKQLDDKQKDIKALEQELAQVSA